MPHCRSAVVSTTVLALGLLIGPVAGAAESTVGFAGAFTSAMVLQRERPLPVWGQAVPGSSITLEGFGQRKSGKADAEGRWRIVLDPIPATAKGGTLKATGTGGSATLDDVLVGDVWLLTGAGSNRTTEESLHAKDALAVSEVRVLHPDHYRSLVPVSDLPRPSQWAPLTTAAAATWPLGWQFARNLQKSAGVPVGLILASRDPEESLVSLRRSGGKALAAAQKVAADKLVDDIVQTEAWLGAMDRRRDGDPIDNLVFPTYIPFEIYGGRHPRFGWSENPYKNFQPATVFNSVIHPLAPVALRGVVLGTDYKADKGASPDDVPGIVEDWRAAWGRPNLPFVLIEPSGNDTATSRQGVAKAAGLPAVTVVTMPAKYDERDGAELWASVATAAQGLPVDAPGKVPDLPVPAPAAVVKLPTPAAKPPLETAHIFADHMVLQADKPLVVWGWAAPAEPITVEVAGHRGKAAADDRGRWRITLEPLPAGDQPLTLTVSGDGRQQQFSDVVVGEVWLNSGQSNSGYTMSGTIDYATEKPKADRPLIRMFRSISYASALPTRLNSGFWVAASPETVGKFSGMGYHFARALQDRKKVPVGIIEANHGGSFIKSWMSDAALQAIPEFASERAPVRQEMLDHLPEVIAAVRAWTVAARNNATLERPMPAWPINLSPMRPWYGAGHNPKQRRGAMFYNGTVGPMVGYPIRGMLWNQGEADTTSNLVGSYDRMLQAMVTDLRSSWGDEFPFYLVQMPALQGRDNLLEMWLAQARALKLIPHTALTVSNDISEPERGEGGIHPRDKKTVGERMVRLAMSRVYGQPDPADSSPLFAAADRQGSAVAVTFQYAGEGLKTRDGKPADSWEIAGADGVFHPAKATLAGAVATVSAPEVTVPTQVRLGWKSTSNCNLVNSAGLPALPFTAKIGK